MIEGLRCRRCREIKPEEEFAWRRRRKLERDTYCRPCRSAYGKEHYAANRQRYIDQAAIVRPLFATAYEDGAVRANPTLGVRLRVETQPDGQERKPKALTREELRLVLVALPDEWRSFFTLLAQTGLRISEAFALTWGDIDLGTRPRLKVRRQIYRGQLSQLKTKYSRREIPLTPSTAQALREKRVRDYRGDDAWISATVVGTLLSDHNLRRRILKPAVEPLGLGWVGFHTFRHTCASLLFAGGNDVKVVQEWLGHADPGFTLRTYVHLLNEGLGSADFLDEATTPLPAPSSTLAECDAGSESPPFSV